VGSATATDSAANILSRRPIPTLGQVQNLESIARSWFNSLQVSATQPLMHGLSLTANYVWSKTLTSKGIQNTTLSAQDYNNLAAERGAPTRAYGRYSTWQWFGRLTTTRGAADSPSTR